MGSTLTMDTQNSVVDRVCLHGRMTMIARLHFAILAALSVATVPLTRMFAFPNLLRLERRTVEVENKLKGWRQPPTPIAGHSRALIPHIPAKTPPPLLAHPRHPAIPIRPPFTLFVNQAQVDEHLPSLGHGEIGEHPAHEGVPIAGALAAIVSALVRVRRRREAEIGFERHPSGGQRRQAFVLSPTRRW